uniref:Uncharacterized protein n=1 Tax=Anguilla anguilla TaxID=7936 RepID=A0A0E9UIL4_ANGAN
METLDWLPIFDSIHPPLWNTCTLYYLNLKCTENVFFTFNYR